ncbi:unnamed protein product, partial [Dibothriocephalus latus]
SQEVAHVVQKFLDPIQYFTRDNVFLRSGWDTFDMRISATRARPDCRTVQSAALVKDVWCTIQTSRVDILIQRMSQTHLPSVGLLPARLDHVEMAIPEAVLNVMLEEKLSEYSALLTHILKLAELRIQNIISIINAHKRSIPKAEINAWKNRALVNTGKLLQKAVLQRGVKQCQL